MIAYFAKRPLAAVACVILLLVAFFSVFWIRGRQSILSDLNTPRYGQPSSVTLLFRPPHLETGLTVMESLRKETPIAKEMSGAIESKAYTMPVIGLRYVKISAPTERIQEIASVAQQHLATRYPGVKPEISSSDNQSPK